MKKPLLKIICSLIILSLIVSCSKDEDTSSSNSTPATIIGKWNEDIITVNYVDFINSSNDTTYTTSPDPGDQIEFKSNGIAYEYLGYAIADTFNYVTNGNNIKYWHINTTDTVYGEIQLLTNTQLNLYFSDSVPSVSKTERWFYCSK